MARAFRGSGRQTTPSVTNRNRSRKSLGVGVLAAGLIVTLAPAGSLLAGPGPASAAAQPAANRAESQPDSAYELPSGRTSYRTWADYQSDMDSLVQAHPDLVRRITLPERTTKGEPVYGLEISANVDQSRGKPDLLITGMHHGNEWASGEVTMEFGFTLAQGYGHDRRITRMLKRARVILVPVVNVDGFIANTRVNGRGVDINRNYGLGWGGIPTNENVGTGAFSEPEARNVRDVIEGNQVPVYLTMHTCEAMVLYPPLSYQAGTPQNAMDFARVGRQLARPVDYQHKASADDYQTTGEVISWSYYATGGLGFTVEDCTVPAFDPDVPKTFQTMVVNQYLGVGEYTGNAHGGMRKTFLTALGHVITPSSHATIVGNAPNGALLTVRKNFNLWTAPTRQANGSIAADRVPTHLSSTMTVHRRNGSFSWAVNPSVRPKSAYRRNGIQTHHPRYYQESWTLTCARPDGRVLQRTKVKVARGESTRVDLTQCVNEF